MTEESVELVNACSNLVWLTVSKTFENSIVIGTVRSSGFAWLNPTASFWTSGSRLRTVLESVSWRSCVSLECRSLSRILISGQRREMYLWELRKSRGLPTLGFGMIVACFHMAGMSADRRYSLHRSVRFYMPNVPDAWSQALWGRRDKLLSFCRPWWPVKISLKENWVVVLSSGCVLLTPWLNFPAALSVGCTSVFENCRQKAVAVL